jgi:hypothetical protein
MYLCAFSSTYFLSLSLILIFKSFFNRRIFVEIFFGLRNFTSIELVCGGEIYFALQSFRPLFRPVFFGNLWLSKLVKSGQAESKVGGEKLMANFCVEREVVLKDFEVRVEEVL